MEVGVIHCLCEAWDNGNVQVGVVRTVCMKCGTVTVWR